MRNILMAGLLLYVSLLIVTASIALWIPRSEECRDYFTEDLMSYALAPAWYPICKLTHLTFKCPEGWDSKLICGGK